MASGHAIGNVCLSWSLIPQKCLVPGCLFFTCIWLAWKSFALMISFLVWEMQMLCCGTGGEFIFKSFSLRSQQDKWQSPPFSLHEGIFLIIKVWSKVLCKLPNMTHIFFKENRGNVKCLGFSWRNRGLFSDDGKREWSSQSIHCLNRSVRTRRCCQAFDESRRINLKSNQLFVYRLNQDHIFFNSNSEIKVITNLSCELLSF